MTPAQIELARHALGLGNGRSVSYRNRFVCGLDHWDYADWQSMSDHGLAKRYGPKQIFGGDYCFILTREGAEMALKPGERLDAEDFT